MCIPLLAPGASTTREQWRGRAASDFFHYSSNSLIPHLLSIFLRNSFLFIRVSIYLRHCRPVVPRSSRNTTVCTRSFIHPRDDQFLLCHRPRYFSHLRASLASDQVYLNSPFYPFLLQHCPQSQNHQDPPPNITTATMVQVSSSPFSPLFSTSTNAPHRSPPSSSTAITPSSSQKSSRSKPAPISPMKSSPPAPSRSATPGPNSSPSSSGKTSAA